MDKKVMNKYQKLLLSILPFVILIGVFGVYAVKSGLSLASSQTDKKNDTTYSYCYGLGYRLDSDATDYQKALFKELNNTIEKGEDKDIAILVVENFVADFFNWTDKVGSYDVGGMYFVFSESKANIYTRARETFYKYLSTYLNEYEKKDLLEVKNIQVESASDVGQFEYNGKTYDSYYIRLKWEYEDNKFDAYGYQRIVNATVIKNADGRFEIVEFYGD